ncbi:MAG: T9SS type A sorting domain-containing protein [bacterium]|nr:T9SS type A sorting domain-containing protein [bacterium]
MNRIRNKKQGRGGSTCSHLPILFIGILLGTNLFADNAVFNPGFDMTPWDSGWTSAGSDVYEIRADTGICLSPPNGCYISGFGGWGVEGCGKITQTIYPPAINCTCKVFLKYLLGTVYSGFADVWFDININNKWKEEWNDRAGVMKNDIDSTKNWISWEKVYAVNDTIRGIRFSAGAGTVSPDGMAGARLYIDDVYISGEEVGVEEPSQGSLKPPLQAVDLKIIKNKICLSVPNDYYPNMEHPASAVTLITIYDLTGRPKETVYEGTLTKGDYTFTPNIQKSGVYFVRLSTICHSDTERSEGEESNIITETKKLILVK